MRVVPIPCLSDNYAYLLVSPSGREAIAIDPSEAAPVLSALAQLGAGLAGIWLTHHHHDHVGGIEGLLATLPDDARRATDVLASAYDFVHGRISGQTRGLEDEARFAAFGREVRVLSIPGHTLGAVAYVVDDLVFTGDTLFLGGCGRVFEGTMPQMWASLASLRTLPGRTRVYCGHEYTLANLEFARTVEPGNDALLTRIAHVADLRSRDMPTVPGTIEEEHATNPFLRCDVAAVSLGRSAAATFEALRRAKDAF